MKRTVALIATFAVIVVLLLAASAARKPKPPSATAQQIWEQSGVPVETAAVGRGDMAESVQVTGDLVALDSAVVSPKVSGRLTSISIREGDHVSKGQVVAVLDQGDAQSGLESARAGLESARARLAQARTAADVTRMQTQSAIAQAQAGLRSALAKLEVAKKPTRSQDRMVAENRVNSAKANLDRAEADYKRNERLLKRGAISESAFDVVKAQYLVAQADYQTAQQQLSLIEEGGRQEDVSSAQAQVDVARGQLRDAKTNASQYQVKEKDILAARAVVLQAQAAVDTANRQLGNTYIRSSIAGTVSTRTAEPGQVVAPGQTLATVVNLGSVCFKADVSELAVAQIKRTRQVDVRIEALSGKTFAGRVVEIYPSGSTANRNFTVRVALANAGTELRPGMFATGEVGIALHRNVIVVPKESVNDSGGTQSVFVVARNKTAKKVVVTIARTDARFAEIAVPTELKVGDRVVTQGLKNVQDGTKLELNNGGKSDVAH